MSKRAKTGGLILVLAAFCAMLGAQQSVPPAAPTSLPPTHDPKEIIRRALELDQEDFELARNYTYEQRVDMKMLDKQGGSKHHEVYTDDVIILYGQPYYRRIRKDDKPLADKDEKKEQEKLDKFVAKYKNESEHDREKRLAKNERERQDDRKFSGDVINAYDFRLVGEDRVEGRPAFVIEASPRKDFHPTQPHADMLTKFHGKVWVDEKTYGWVKLELETLDTISWGFLVARLHPGSKITFEQARVNDEIWLPRRIVVDAGVRFALFMNATFAMEFDYSNYQKFSTNVRILPEVTQIPPRTIPSR